MKKDAAILLLKYLENKCSPDDLGTIIHLIGTKEDDRELQTLLYEYWKNTPSFQHRIAEEELNQILDSVHHRINLHENKQKAVIKRIIYYAIRIAAVLFVPLLIVSVWMFLNDGIYHRDDQYITLETQPGSKLKTVLPDGTEVWQNAGTTLQYPAKFTKQNREVILTGEAYFHVSSDLRNPFYVKTTDGTIKVTGTKFNVSAFPDDSFSSVVLEEGKVSYIPANKKKAPVTLRQEEQVTYLKGTGSLIKEKTDVEKYTSWKEGKLIFRNDPLSKVIIRLQRWYNAEITLSDPGHLLGGLTFTMTVKNETLPQVLEYLSQASNLSFKQQKTDRNTNMGPEKTKYLLFENTK
ncbi:MAG: FecR domain-containing protein [Prolixibacteraceae bacterium]